MRSFFVFLFILHGSIFAFEKDPPRPWHSVENQNLPPATPGEDYNPVVVPNGFKADYVVRDNAKVFHLTAEVIDWELAHGLKVKAWGINGSFPGPVLEAAVGDKVQIYVTNHLPAGITLHWHGMLIPCGMDGVHAVTQRSIPPGETFMYEFYLPNAGTFMYHSHDDSMVQEGLGLVGMFIVHEREKQKEKRPDRDFAILLHEWQVGVGTARPNIFDMGGFNILTMNGKCMPATEPLVAKLGDMVWIRFGNLGAMDHHPIHLHGYSFKIIGSDGGFVSSKEGLLPETTVLVPVGATRVIEFLADNPGDWIFHCHMTHHTMNQMGHGVPNMIGVEMGDVEEKIRSLIPGYMTMGTKGMRDMAQSGMPIPQNSIPMLGYDGQFGDTVMGGMANILRVREHLDSYEDPGPYHFPKETHVRKVNTPDW